MAGVQQDPARDGEMEAELLNSSESGEVVAQPMREYWAERCMYEVMKLESNAFERIEQVEKSFESQIQQTLVKQHELEERLQPSGSATERYDSGLLESCGDATLRQLSAAIEDLRNQLNQQGQQREAEVELNRRELRAELQEQVQQIVADQLVLIDSTKAMLGVDLKQGFDRLRADLGMQPQRSMGTEQVDELEPWEQQSPVRFASDAMDKQFLDLQTQRTQTEFALRELNTRLEATERAAFEIEEPASLVKRLAILESYSGQDGQDATVMMLLNSIDARVELLEKGNSRGGAFEQGSMSAWRSEMGGQDVSGQDMRYLLEAMKAAITKTQSDLVDVAEGLTKERAERHSALAEVDSLCHVVAKAAASTIERLDFAVGNQDESGCLGSPSPSAVSALNALGAVANASGSQAEALNSPQEMANQLRLRGLEARTNVFEERLNRELMMQGHRLEVIDASTKAELRKHSDKYQAACELGTRTLLLEKAVKWLLEDGMARSPDRAGAPPPILRTSSLEPQIFCAAEVTPMVPPPQVQRMYSVGPSRSGSSVLPPCPAINRVFRSQSQPLQTGPMASQSPQVSLRPPGVPGTALQAAVAKFMHRTGSLGQPDTSGQVFVDESGMLSNLWRNESQVLSPLLTALQPQAPRSASPAMKSRCSSQDMSPAAGNAMPTPGSPQPPMRAVTPPRMRLNAAPSQPKPQQCPPLQPRHRQQRGSPRQQQQPTRVPVSGRRSNGMMMSQQPGSPRPSLSARPLPGPGYSSPGGSFAVSPPRVGSSDVPVRPRASSGGSPSGGSPRGAYHWIASRPSAASRDPQDPGATRGRSNSGGPMVTAPGTQTKPSRGMPGGGGGRK